MNIDARTKALGVAAIVAGASAAAWFLVLEEMVFGSDVAPVATTARPKPAPAPAAKPAPTPEPKTSPAMLAQPAEAPKATPVVAPVAAPAVVAQAPTAAEAPKEDKPKPIARKPRAKPAAQEPAVAGDMPKAVEVPPARPVVAAKTTTDAGLRFNDLATAVLYRDPKTVEDLLAFGKWPDKPDSRGMTPLMLAADLGDSESAEALLRAGANPNVPGPGGETAITLARERNDAAMIGLLRKYGAR